MKWVLLCLGFLACGLLPVGAEEIFKPRVDIDHKGYMDEALAHVLKERPEINATDLEVVSLAYGYQTMPGTTIKCGPDGCVISPAAPFSEHLVVGFKLKKSEREVTKEGQTWLEWDGLSVQFPTPRRPHWFIGKSTISSMK